MNRTEIIYMDDNQIRALRFLEKYIDFMLVNGFHPTMSNMMNEWKISHETIRKRMKLLAEMGEVEITTNRDRSWIMLIPGVYFVDNRDEDYDG